MRVAKWSDILILISIVPAEDTNENGFNQTAGEDRREVFANKKSVGYSEFYKSAQAGYCTELKFDVHAHEYGGQSLVEYEGKQFKVLRTYASKSGEFLELTLTDLSERAAVSPEAPEGGESGG